MRFRFTIGKTVPIFNFVKPMANQGFKASSLSFLTVKGEIDSLYKTAYDPATGSPVENSVSLWLTHIPRNPIKGPKILVEGRPAVIKPSDYAHSTITSKYLFENDFPISLEGLEDGEIEIVAYKNREGSAWDDKITRVVYIDAGRLWIDLVQPNVFTSDLLDSDVKIRNFNENTSIDGEDTNITITEDGVITLKSTGSVLEKEGGISGMNRIVEAADGTLYGLVNTSTSSARVYQKLPGKSQWEVLFSQSGIYAYDLVSTPIGILLGVSNIPANGNSGLYLLSGTKMTNIKFPEQSLPHVQFVIFQGKRVYLYGSLYDYLYSFSLYDIGEAEGKYQVRSLTRTPLPFTGHIKQFILSEGAEIAVIRTDENEDNIHLYRRKEAGYQKTSPPSLGDTKTLSGTSLIYGPYDYNSSSYESFLILKEDGEAALQNTIEVLMRNRTTGRFFRHSVDLTSADWLGASASLLGVGFSDSQYTFVYNDPNRMQSKTGQIFFETFTTENATPSHDIPINSYIEASGWPLFITSGGVIYLGLGYDILTDASESGLYRFYKSSAGEGEGSFNYINDDIDGLTGFSFEVDPAQAGAVDFGFSLKTRNDGSTLFSFPADHSKKPIQELIDDPKGEVFSNDDYILSKEYNLETGRYLFHIELSELRSNAFFNFSFALRSVQGLAPAIHAVEVFKKIPAKITSAPGGKINLPIKGYVYDRTVEVVSIQHEEVSVGRDGSFSHNYRVENPQSRLPVNISCYNGAGVRADMQFFLEIVESENGLWNISYGLGGSPEEPLEPTGDGPFLVRTTERELSLSGEYFGLTGAVVGYEIYSTRDGEDQRSLERGRFITTKTTPTQNSVGGSLGPDYESGRFTTAQKIKLIPNEQRLVIYVENPGGIRHQYTAEVGGQPRYPHFDYSMPADEQKIRFDAVNEAWALEGEGPPYVFTAEGIITGEILSLENFKDVLVRSFSPGLVFSNSQEEMVLPLEAGNRFSIPFTAEMGDQEVERVFTVEVIPTIPAYSYMRKRIEVTVKKNFENTHFVPDFSAIHPGSSTEEHPEANGGGVPIHFTFQGRDDMPTPDKAGDPWVKAVLTINFDKSITGYVDKLSERTYCIRPLDGGSPLSSLSSREIAFADEFKTGVNRVQWHFIYMEAGSQTGYTMSSSGRSGMEDFMFTLDNVRDIAETTVFFHPDLDGRYYNNNSSNTEDHLPSLEIAKDAATDFIIRLNDQVVWEDTENKVTSDTVNLPAASIWEGRNQLEIETKEGDVSKETLEYSFLYDSAPPAVHIATTRVDDSFRYLIEVSATVTEANFRRAYLYSGTGLVNRDPRVEKLGKDTYLLTWENLRDLNLESGSIRVEVRDAAGNSGEAQADGFAARERPDTARPREININLPKYDGEPRTAIEDGYESRELAAHTDEELIDNPAYQKLVAPEGSVSDYFGNSVSVDGDYALVGAWAADIDGKANAGAAYIFERVSGGWEQKEKLTATDGSANDYFGYSVSLDGDYALVGARNADPDGKSAAGAAYIFERVSGGWEQKEKLTATDGSANDYFGYSVSLDGDYALVGAYGDDDKGGYAGAAYIFERDLNGDWSQKEKLVAADGNAGDRFGHSVSLDGDYALVGAYGDDDKGGYAGAAYIFERGSGGWEQKKKLLPSDGSAGDEFGRSVSLDGDYALVGAIQADIDGKANAGAAYIFECDLNGDWSQKKKLTASDGSTRDMFGISVSLDGDYALVGARYADVDGKANAGAAYIFERGAEGWIQKKKLTASDGSADDRFGYSVSLDGDYALVGANSADVNGKNSAGAAYYFNLQGLSLGEGYRDFSARTKFAPQLLPKRESVRQKIIDADGLLIDNPSYQKLVAFNWSASARFGRSVSVDGDYALVGASAAYVDGKGYVGAAYIFERVSGGWEQKEKLTATGGSAGFGYSVSLDGDYALVGAPYANVDGENNAGAAYIFKRVSGGWEQKAKLTAEFINDGDQFGHSVSLDGDYALVGAPYADVDGENNAGAAYIFVRGSEDWESEDWEQEAKLTAEVGNADDNDWFGYSVSLDGDYALVGGHAWAAYIFVRVSVGWEQEAKLTAEVGSSWGGFGDSVSLDGDYALVGAPYAEVDGKSNIGAAYIFERGSEDWEQKEKLTDTDGSAFDNFGYSVSLDGDYALVGARNADADGKIGIGAAYIFERGSEDWIQKKKLTASDVRASDHFCTSVSLDGDYALVGAILADVNGKNNAGAAYFFNIQTDISHPIASDKSLLDDEGMDYLVFEVPKDPLVNQLTKKNQLEGEIGFEVYGYAQNSDTLDLVKVDATAPLTLEDGAEHYVEGLRNLYYMVDIDALKAAFRDTAESIVFSADDWNANLGRLKIVYDENGSLPNFTADNVTDIYVTGGSDDTFADIIVYDGAYTGDNVTNNRYLDVHENLQHSMEERTTTLSGDSDKFSLSFWLRIEDEDAADALYSKRYKRLLTFRDKSGNDMYHLGYKGTSLELIEETPSSNPSSPQALIGGDTLPLTPGRDAWNLITLRIDPTVEGNGAKGVLVIDVYDSVEKNYFPASPADRQGETGKNTGIRRYLLLRRRHGGLRCRT